MMTSKETVLCDDSEESRTLRQIALDICKPLDIGAAVLPRPLFEEDTEKLEDKMGNATVECCQDEKVKGKQTRYAEVLSSEFNAVVIEHHLKWAPLCHTLPGPIDEKTPSTRIGRYDFGHVDAMVDWAMEKKMKVKGHVLVWAETTPPYLEEMSEQQVWSALRSHIYTTVGHFRGRIKVWDVVNESLAPDGSLANNIFLRKLGPTYIEKSFIWAHEADPDAFLIYNDNKVEGMNGPNKRKADAFYELLKKLVDAKIPIHGAGMQAHFNAGGKEYRQLVPTPYMVKNQIRRLGELGLKVNISEMDVRVSKLPVDKREKAQKQVYHDIIAAALTEPAFDGVWLWGFTDRHTWVQNFYYDDSPLIFDNEYNRKSSYYGLRDAVKTMSIEGKVGGGVILSDRESDWGSDWREKIACDEVDDQANATGDSRPDWLQA